MATITWHGKTGLGNEQGTQYAQMSASSKFIEFGQANAGRTLVLFFENAEDIKGFNTSSSNAMVSARSSGETSALTVKMVPEDSQFIINNELVTRTIEHSGSVQASPYPEKLTEKFGQSI